MIVEFLGIGVFSYLMGSINSLMGSDYTLQDIIDERMENVEMWLRKLEKSRSKNFSTPTSSATLTTVGYGDFKGYTPIEYLI